MSVAHVADLDVAAKQTAKNSVNRPIDASEVADVVRQRRIVLISRNSSSPKTPASRPIPDCL
ncbi:hypothetical protein GON09_002002 [Rhodococcus sp. B50]|nr:hypothetical protein [Rhodococcus sp. B50]